MRSRPSGGTVAAVRRLALLTVLLTLTLLLAGCGDDGGDAFEVLAAAPAATAETGSARTAVRLDTDGIVGAGDAQVEMEGVLDFEQDRTELTIDLGRALDGLGLDGTMVVRAIGTELFLQSSLFRGTVAGVDAGTWLRVDLEAAADSQGLDLDGLGGLGPAGNGDPRQGLAVLNGVVEGGIDEVGDDEVRGVATTHYRARIDLERAAERAGDMVDPEAFDHFVEMLGDDSVRIDVWVDGDDLVRRIRIPVRLPAGAGGGEVTFTAEYYDFGADIEVPTPDPADVRDLQDIVDQIG